MADDNGPSQSLRCDGTPHPPTATPPLPFHDWRWDGDDPYIVCGRCAQMQDSRSGRVIRQGDTGAVGVVIDDGEVVSGG